MNIDLEITPKQKLFIETTEDEVLFGGAAGGGKSHGQIIDALLYALKYPNSKQLILRRTFAELEKSLIRKSKEIYPTEICTYNASKYVYTFVNGSIIDFGYIGTENDVHNYQSAEYDVIRFDELTHFTEYMYTYLISRLRGATKYPRSMKSTTNPGNVGHTWVRKRFVDIAPPNTSVRVGASTRRFIPAKVDDNLFLMQNDPQYVDRLENLNEDEKRMLLYGDWDVFQGQYFAEFNRKMHVVDPFPIPDHWQRYRAIDYGLDMLACLWAAFDELGNAYVYKEFCKPNLVISKAAQGILERTADNEDIVCTFGPADMWGRNRDSGKAQADLFAEYGLPLVKVRNPRVDGWLNIKEWLRLYDDGTGERPRLQIFSTCTELISCLPQLLHDEKNPSDVSIQPHEITHAPDALRYLMDGRPRPAEIPIAYDEDDYIPFDDQIDNFLDYGR